MTCGYQLLGCLVANCSLLVYCMQPSCPALRSADCCTCMRNAWSAGVLVNAVSGERLASADSPPERTASLSTPPAQLCGEEMIAHLLCTTGRFRAIAHPGAIAHPTASCAVPCKLRGVSDCTPHPQPRGKVVRAAPLQPAMLARLCARAKD